MNETVVSSKNQVVIPKAIRKQVGWKPGQRVTTSVSKNGQVILTPIASPLEKVAKLAGSMPGAWGAEDATTMIRKLRDDEDKHSDRRSR